MVAKIVEAVFAVYRTLRSSRFAERQVRAQDYRLHSLSAGLNQP